MRRAAAQTHDVEELPPFVLFFSATDPLRFFNYARPMEPLNGDLSEALAKVRAAFADRQRTPRFEFIEEFAPALGPLLEGAGCSLEDRYLLMVCTRDTLKPAPVVPGLEVKALSATDPLPLLRAFKSVQAHAFEEEELVALDEDSVGSEDIGQRFVESGAFLGLLDGAPASAVDFTAPLDGFTELVGLGTLVEFRRRGIGAALIAHATRAAFDLGVEIAFLTAGDANAGRVYERVGFRPFASLLAYIERPHS